jgi:spore germination cell wall hydrolase CwlJ-like protein
VVKLLGGRIAAAVIGLFMLGLGSSAAAQNVSPLDVTAAVKAVGVDPTAPALGTPSAMIRPAIATTAVVAPNGTIQQAQPAQSVTVQFAEPIAKEAAWLYRAGWPLYALVGKYATGAQLDQETNCLATAVYFEARGESLEGQLAVARVVMNRASSGRYPSDWCGVVKQPAQFSFVRHGEFPAVDTNSQAWQKAEAIAELAAANIVPSVSSDVLWYHADYVAPNWRRSLQEVQQIGAHIFYRA